MHIRPAFYSDTLAAWLDEKVSDDGTLREITLIGDRDPTQGAGDFIAKGDCGCFHFQESSNPFLFGGDVRFVIQD